MTNTKAHERIWAFHEPVGEYGHYFPETVEAEGEYGGTAVEYILTDLAPQWQDIATAPKDGTTIFVISYSDGKWWKPDLAHWDENSGRWENGESYDEWPLTHWHPAGTLPTPPEPTQ